MFRHEGRVTDSKELNRGHNDRFMQTLQQRNRPPALIYPMTHAVWAQKRQIILSFELIVSY